MLYRVRDQFGRDDLGVVGVLVQFVEAERGPDVETWTGNGWSPDEAAAHSLMLAGHPFGISVGDYTADGHGLVMVEQTSLAGGFQVWQARSPAGPWRRIITGQVPCSGGPQRGAEGLCRAVIGHPELSTRGQLVVSYFDPGNDHVDVSAYPWLSP